MSKLLKNGLLISLLACTFAVYADCGLNKMAADGVITNETTGLMWSQCLFGQSGKRCESGGAAKLSWVDAFNKVRGSELAGYTNWRLPRIEEIESLIATCSDRQQVFPTLTKGSIWSSSANLDFNTKAWAFNLTENKREKVSRDSERSFLSFLLVRNSE